MFKHFNTYRRFLFGLLIVSYGFSVFQNPVFEVLHLMYHIPGIVYSSVQIHSYESHNGETHQHENLAKLELKTTDQENPTPVQNELEIKKKIEIIDKTTAPAIVDIYKYRNSDQAILPFKSAFKKIPNPPPELFS